MSSLVMRDATVTRTNIALAPAARTVGVAAMIEIPSETSRLHDPEGSLVCRD
jgi:hypothetical protein